MIFQQISPVLRQRTAAELLRELVQQAPVPSDRPYLFLNMVSSVDGRATIAGSSCGLGDDADTQFLLELRGVADAVLIGVGTVRAEGYGRLVGTQQTRVDRKVRGLLPDPPAVIVSRRFDIPWDAGLFSAPDQPVIIFTETMDAAIPEVRAPVEIVNFRDCSLPQVVKYLRTKRNIKLLLCEGGPTLNGALFDSKLVDDLFLTLAPVIKGNEPVAGDAGRDVNIVEGAELINTQSLHLSWVLQHESELFLRYRIESANG